MNAMRIISMELSVSDTGSCCHGQICMTLIAGSRTKALIPIKHESQDPGALELHLQRHGRRWIVATMFDRS